MTNYKIYYREADEKIKAVGIGWNSDAFVFGPFWAASNKMWGIFFFYFAFFIVLAIVCLYFNKISLFFILFVFAHIELGLHGNDNYLDQELYHKSYIEYTEIKANTPDKAESIFRKEQAKLKREEEESIAEDKRYEEQIKRDEEEWEKYTENEEKKEESKRAKNSEEQDIEKARERLINNEISLEEYENIKKKIAEKLKEKEGVDKADQSDNENDYIAKLKDVKDLLDKGAISLEEYEKLKQKIMSEL